MIFFKEKFRSLRERQNLTRKEVSESIGVSEGMVQKRDASENFQTRPKKISRLARKIIGRAKTRAAMHRKLLLETIHNEIGKQFPNATEPKRDKILLKLVSGTIGEA